MCHVWVGQLRVHRHHQGSGDGALQVGSGLNSILKHRVAIKGFVKIFWKICKLETECCNFEIKCHLNSQQINYDFFYVKRRESKNAMFRGCCVF